MYRYGRSILFPPALIATVWAVTISAIWLCGDLYFPLTSTALDIVLVGVFAFSVGSLLAVHAPVRVRQTISGASAFRRSQIDRYLNWAVVLMVLNLPFFFLYLKSLSGSIAPRESMWKQVRIASNKANVSGGGVSHIESMLLPFLSIVALIAVCEYADTVKKPWRTALIVLMAAGYQMVNGARSEVLLVLVSCVVLLWLRRGVAPTRLLVSVGLTFLFVFAVNQVAMNKYGAGPGASLEDNLPRVAEGFGTYWLGGIIAFDQNRAESGVEIRLGTRQICQTNRRQVWRKFSGARSQPRIHEDLGHPNHERLHSISSALYGPRRDGRSDLAHGHRRVSERATYIDVRFMAARGRSSRRAPSYSQR